LLDLYPTLIDLCGLPGNPNKNTTGELLGGYSLKPLLIDPSGSQWIGPPFATTVIASEDPFASLDKQHISVRSERWRYTLCADGEEELYDHLYDPNEWTNLALDKEFENIKHQHKKHIRELLDKVSAYKQDN
jgi:iduronate 2-sulfatase